MLNTSNTKSADASKQSVPVAGGCPQEGVAITLPDGEVIVVDRVPHEGWGYEPGKRYCVYQRNDNDVIIWERSWVIPVGDAA